MGFNSGFKGLNSVLLLIRNRGKKFYVVTWYLSSIILQLERTDSYIPHPVHIEMEEFSDVRFKQRAVIDS